MTADTTASPPGAEPRAFVLLKIETPARPPQSGPERLDR